MNRTFQFIFYTTLFLVTIPIHAQKLLNEHPIKFKPSFTTTPFSVIDSEQNTNLFFVTKNKVNTGNNESAVVHIKYDKDHTVTHHKTLARLPLEFQKMKISGYSLAADNTVNLYFSNHKKTMFFLKSIRPDGTTKQKEFDFKIKKEVFVQAINHQNKFYILTAPKSSQSLKIYEFVGDTYEEINYNLSREAFYNEKNKKEDLFGLFSNETIEILEDEVPSSIEITSKPFKLYPKGNELILTLDHRDSATRIIRLNLLNKSAVVTHIPISTLPFKNLDYLSSNSFIYKDRIYQLIASRELMVFTVKDIATKNILKEYSAQKDDEEITFKNSPIFQEGGMYDTGIRELAKTKQFLRKITASDVGIVAYEKEGLLHLNMGGFKKIQSGGAPMMMPGFGGMPVAGLGAVTMSINPLFYAYSSYNNTRSVFIKCLFDANTIEHLPGPVSDNVFDKIYYYAKYIEKKHLETIFRKDSFFVYGYYDKKRKYYRLFRFDK